MAKTTIAELTEIEPEDDELDLSGWYGSETTKRFEKDLLLNVQRRLTELVAVCSRSSDPDVRGAHQAFMQSKVAATLIKAFGTHNKDAQLKVSVPVP